MKFAKYLMLLVLSLSFVANASSMKKMDYKIDATKSKVTWTGKKVTGQHVGTINVKSGSLKYDGTNLTGGEFVIDMTSINTTDLSGEWKGKLDNHLKGEDFFNTSKNKTAKLVIKSAQFGKGGHWDVNADLTIKGITKPVMFKANLVKKKGALMADAKLKINRLDYGVKYKSGKFFKGLGDKMIYDDFELDIKLVTK
jgi:polyisoprenoid-binding protein YceI